MKKIILSLALATYPLSCSAVTIEQALTSGYNHNEELKAIRVDFLTEIEAFPRALAGFMPRVSITAKTQEAKTSYTTQNVTANNSQYTRSLNIEQPVFDGMSSVSELKAAQSVFRAARGEYYAKEQDNFLKQINVYLSCVEAKEKHNISKISVKSNKTQLEAMREKFKLGEATETEVAAAREGLATAEANEAFSYANYEFARANFLQTFGIDAVGLEMPAVPSDLPGNSEVLKEMALAGNFSVHSSNHRTKSSKAIEYAAKGKLLPRASVVVSHGNTRYFPENTTANNYNTDSTTALLSVTVPIIERGGLEYSDVRRAKYQTKKSIIAHDNVVKQINANCQGRWSDFEASKIRVKATEQAVASAKIAYDGMVQEELLGSKTIIDVLRAEERLNKAREARVEAKKALVLAGYQIKSLVGDLTAKAMHLDVEYFNPELEFKKVKNKIVGF
jgi:outer membrane protein